MTRKGSGKALSYILSVVMMTLVTTSLASVVLLWGLGQTAESQNSFGLAVDARMDKTRERLVVEDVQFNKTGLNDTVIFIRNIGKVQIVIDQVYLNHTTVAIDAKLVLGVQKTGNITVTFVTSSLLSKGTYYVVVATSRGTTYEDYYTYAT